MPTASPRRASCSNRPARRPAAHLADLTTEAGAQSLIDATVARFGRIDILVNNAAIRRNQPFTEITLKDWHEVLANSLDCAFLCARYAVPHMRQSKWGRIVNIGGITQFKGTPGRAHVAAAKAGMAGMTRVLAAELGADGITANMVAPGAIDTVRGGAAGQRPAVTRGRRRSARPRRHARRDRPHRHDAVPSRRRLHHRPGHPGQRRRAFLLMAALL